MVYEKGTSLKTFPPFNNPAEQCDIGILKYHRRECGIFRLEQNTAAGQENHCFERALFAVDGNRRYRACDHGRVRGNDDHIAGIDSRAHAVAFDDERVCVRVGDVAAVEVFFPETGRKLAVGPVYRFAPGIFESRGRRSGGARFRRGDSRR